MGVEAGIESLQTPRWRKADSNCWSHLEREVEWVVYAKRPFGGPQQVLDYLGRYTHRVAISNSRLIAAADGQIRFRWKD
jgi:hypothetical protein